MNRGIEWLRKAWTRLRIRQHEEHQAKAAREDRKAAERLQDLQDGGNPYGRPGPGSGMGIPGTG